MPGIDGPSAGLTRDGVPAPAGGAPPDVSPLPVPAAAAYAWPAATATGVGSLPGTDPLEAARLVLGELPDLPHLPELPGRGAGADLTGRTASLLVDLPVETTAGGWRFTDRPGRDLSRARAFLSADLDALEEAAQGFRGTLKIQVCGPWTLAATIELPRSQDPVLADQGAVADLTASLAEGVAAHLADVRGRVPGARVLVQFDEPALPAVLAGGVPTASGLNRLPAPSAADAAAGLARVVSAAPDLTAVHCCGTPIPFGVITEAGAGAVGFDLALLTRQQEDALAETVEAGLGVLAGAVAALPDAQGPPPDPAGIARPLVSLWHRMGWPRGRAPAGSPLAGVVVTPACGLAGATPARARTVLGRCRDTARLLPELAAEAQR